MEHILLPKFCGNWCFWASIPNNLGEEWEGAGCGNKLDSYPGVAGSEAVHGDECAVELAELLGGLVAVEGDPHDRVCAE